MFKIPRLRLSNNICAILTAAAVPLSLIVASISLNFTIATFIAIGIFILYMRQCILHPQHRDKDRSQLFIIWLTSSVLCLLIVFNAFVINLLEILPEENFVLLILTTICIICLYNTKVRAHQTRQLSKGSYSGDIESTSEEKLLSSNSPTYCNLCQANIPSRHGHCLWLDCCIGSDNIIFYSIANLLAFLSLTYGANLTLTTVCHPIIFQNLILLPDDCGEVYMSFQTAISYVCGIYSLIIASAVALTFIGKIVKKMINIAGFNNDQRTSNMKMNGMMGLFFSRSV